MKVSYFMLMAGICCLVKATQTEEDIKSHMKEKVLPQLMIKTNELLKEENPEIRFEKHNQRVMVKAAYLAGQVFDHYCNQNFIGRQIKNTRLAFECEFK